MQTQQFSNRVKRYLEDCAANDGRAEPETYESLLEQEVTEAKRILHKDGGWPCGFNTDEHHLVAAAVMVHDIDSYGSRMPGIHLPSDDEYRDAARMLTDVPYQPWHDLRRQQQAIIKIMELNGEAINYSLVEQAYVLMRAEERRDYLVASNTLLGTIDTLLGGFLKQARHSYHQAVAQYGKVEGTSELFAVAQRALRVAQRATGVTCCLELGITPGKMLPTLKDDRKKRTPYEVLLHKQLRRIYGMGTPERDSTRMFIPTAKV